MGTLFSFLFGSKLQTKLEIRSDLTTASILQLDEWSRHYDGFIREAVLLRAVELRSPELLDAILERLNDWVPQVRQAARTALLTLVPLLPPSAILRTLPSIDRLHLAKRENHADWIDKYHVAVVNILGGERLLAEAVTRTGEVARSCFDIVNAHSLLSAGELAQRVLDKGADFGTSLAASRLAAGLAANERRTLAEIGWKSSFGAVRTAALRELLTSAGEQADALAEQALLDSQSSVREVAMWHLKQKGYPLAQFYVDKLAQGATAMRRVRICLASLPVCGTREHAAVVERFKDVQHARTQATALLSWARLAPDAVDEILQFALSSRFSRVQKLAPVLMDDFGAYIDLDKAIELAEDRSNHALVLSLARRDPWTWIATILRLASTIAEPSHKEDLIHELQKWLVASANIYTKPTESQTRDLTSRTARRVLNELAGRDVFRAGAPLQQIFELHGLI